MKRLEIVYRHEKLDDKHVKGRQKVPTARSECFGYQPEHFRLLLKQGEHFVCSKLILFRYPSSHMIVSLESFHTIKGTMWACKMGKCKIEKRLIRHFSTKPWFETIYSFHSEPTHFGASRIWKAINRMSCTNFNKTTYSKLIKLLHCRF